ncbi:hypothetical protein DBV15_06413, partial [Temnothorax longispinosus]
VSSEMVRLPSGGRFSMFNLSAEEANDRERETLARFARAFTRYSTTETASIRNEHRHIRGVEGVATPGPNVGVAATGHAKEGGCRETLSRVDVRTITEVGYWHFEPMLLSFKY